MAFTPKAAPAKTAQKAPMSAPRAAPMPAPVPAVRAAQDVALPADLMAELGAAAKDAAAKERPSVGRISLKNGVMSYAGQDLPGNSLDCIVVTSVYRNVYYAGSYDPNNIVNPNCFAISEDENTLQAHENVPDDALPANEDGENPRACSSCEFGQWESDPRPGSKGKACKQTRRLILLPADVLDEENPAEAVLKAEMAILDVPVTSVKNWASLVNALSVTLKLPVWAVVTNIRVERDPKTQFKVHFTPLRAAGDEDIIRSLMRRRDEALRLALMPYKGVGGEEDPDAGKAQPAKKTPNKFAAKRR